MKQLNEHGAGCTGHDVCRHSLKGSAARSTLKEQTQTSLHYSYVLVPTPVGTDRSKWGKQLVLDGGKQTLAPACHAEASGREFGRVVRLHVLAVYFGCSGSRFGSSCIANLSFAVLLKLHTR